MDKKFASFKKSLERVYEHNKLYRDKMRKLNITPDDIKSEEDIQKLPITEKKDFFIDYPYGYYATSQADIKVYHASSGTTGKPLIVGLTENDMKYRSETIVKDLKMAGIQKGDVVQICLGLGMFAGGLSFYEGLRSMGCKIIPTATMSTKMQLFYMKQLKTTVLISSPSHVMRIYEVALENGIDVKSLPLRIIRVGSELMTEKMRRKIKESFGEDVSVTQDYGMTEFLGPGLGMECEYGCGMHLNDDFYFELVDPKTKKKTNGNIGELIISSVYSEAFPLVRYATNDLVQITREKCKCGRVSPRILRFLGRADDMLKVKGVKIFVSQIEDFLFAHPKFNHQYEIVLNDDNYKDSLTINVEYHRKISKDYQKYLKEYEKEIEEEFKNVFGIKSHIHIVDIKTIERPEGKVRRVKDYRTKMVPV